MPTKKVFQRLSNVRKNNVESIKSVPFINPGNILLDPLGVQSNIKIPLDDFFAKDVINGKFVFPQRNTVYKNPESYNPLEIENARRLYWNQRLEDYKNKLGTLVEPGATHYPNGESIKTYQWLLAKEKLENVEKQIESPYYSYPDYYYNKYQIGFPVTGRPEDTIYKRPAKIFKVPEKQRGR